MRRLAPFFTKTEPIQRYRDPTKAEVAMPVWRILTMIGGLMLIGSVFTPTLAMPMPTMDSTGEPAGDVFSQIPYLLLNPISGAIVIAAGTALATMSFVNRRLIVVPLAVIALGVIGYGGYEASVTMDAIETVAAQGDIFSDVLTGEAPDIEEVAVSVNPMVRMKMGWGWYCLFASAFVAFVGGVASLVERRD